MSDIKSEKDEKVIIEEKDKENDLKEEPKEENIPLEEIPKEISEEAEQKENKRIFVKNIPFSTNEDQLREAFAKYGNIIKAEILKKENGRSIGNGIVEFENIEDKKKVLQKEEIIIDDRTLELREARPQRHIDYNKTIYVGNLSYDTTEENLKKFFTDFSPSLKGNFQVNIIRSKFDHSKEYAYVYFDKEEDAKLALTANGRELDKKILTVEMKRMRSGPPRFRRGRFSGNPGRRGGFRGGRRYDDHDRYHYERIRSRSRSNGIRIERERSRDREYERSGRRERDNDRYRERGDRDDRDRRRMNMDRGQV